MRSVLRRLGVAASTLAVTAGSALLLAPSAHASDPDAPACYGAGCVGKSPYVVNRAGVSCAADAYDVVTIGLAGYGSTSVTLRYSPSCAANWARWNGGTSLDYWVQTADGRTASGYGGSAPYYTTMVDGTQLARVCVYSGFDGTQNCSGWH